MSNASTYLKEFSARELNMKKETKGKEDSPFLEEQNLAANTVLVRFKCYSTRQPQHIPYRNDSA